MANDHGLKAMVQTQRSFNELMNIIASDMENYHGRPLHTSLATIISYTIGQKVSRPTIIRSWQFRVYHIARTCSEHNRKPSNLALPLAFLAFKHFVTAAYTGYFGFSRAGRRSKLTSGIWKTGNFLCSLWRPVGEHS